MSTNVSAILVILVRASIFYDPPFDIVDALRLELVRCLIEEGDMLGTEEFHRRIPHV